MNLNLNNLLDIKSNLEITFILFCISLRPIYLEIEPNFMIITTVFVKEICL